MSLSPRNFQDWCSPAFLATWLALQLLQLWWDCHEHPADYLDLRKNPPTTLKNFLKVQKNGIWRMQRVILFNQHTSEAGSSCPMAKIGQGNGCPKPCHSSLFLSSTYVCSCSCTCPPPSPFLPSFHNLLGTRPTPHIAMKVLGYGFRFQR